VCREHVSTFFSEFAILCCLPLAVMYSLVSGGYLWISIDIVYASIRFIGGGKARD
jgi:hypothetical protein